MWKGAQNSPKQHQRWMVYVEKRTTCQRKGINPDDELSGRFIEEILSTGPSNIASDLWGGVK